jgi:adenosylcobinamide-phosphate synthase
MEIVFALLLGFLLDQLLGDPRWLPHPVRWIGRMIQILEAPLRRAFPDRLGGVVLLMLVAGTAGGLTWIILEIAYWCHPMAGVGMSAILIYYGLAARSLPTDTNAVLMHCEQEKWPEARLELSGLVGRETKDLTPEDIYRACIETVAENASDGIIAPLFYAALFGPAGMWVYKAINTLDSMVGYRNLRYQEFGWASARADDVVNYLPARLTYLLLSLAAWLSGKDARSALRVGWRDARKHPSPNAGWPEATMAGALGVALGGPSTYGHVILDKPKLGDSLEALSLEKARQAITIMQMTAWLGLATSLLMAVLAGLADFPGVGPQLRQCVEELFESGYRRGAEIYGQRGLAVSRNRIGQPMNDFLEALGQRRFLVKLVEPSVVPIDDRRPIDLGRQAVELRLALLPMKRRQLDLQSAPIHGHGIEPQGLFRRHLKRVFGGRGADDQVGSDWQFQRALPRDRAARLA